ncbi:MAG TPA: 16S rRNA (uracil(1498)-N(3))-methyltransferase [candidate division Zixibacteria bacterium]|nr:16S rRNA (uracil(1498)-N(3))-methyltransferase [candidate division Zixibacteria bacterium]
MARFFVPARNIAGGRATLAGTELAHLRRVLRLGPGDRVALFDDTGREYEAVIRAVASDAAELEILGSFRAANESPLELILAVAVTKGEKMDLVIEKATELGVSRVVPHVSTRTVPRLDAARSERRLERWRKIALSAAKQCGRTRLPEIAAIRPFAAVARDAWPGTLKIMLWEKEDRGTLAALHAAEPGARSLLLAVGPEGGFSAEEAELARDHGFNSVRLGGRVLRAETAAVAGMALLQFLWGDLGRAPGPAGPDEERL